MTHTEAWTADGRVVRVAVPVNPDCLVDDFPPATVAANNGGLPETAGRVSARPAFSGDPSEAAE